MLSSENNKALLSAADGICFGEVEHDVRTCALWLQEMCLTRSNLFPSVRQGLQSQYDQLLIMTKAKGSYYYD